MRVIKFKTSSGSNSSDEIHVSHKANTAFNPLKQKGGFKILKKPFIYCSGILSCLLVFTMFTSVGCEKLKPVVPTSLPTTTTFLKVEYAGCNNQTEGTKSQRTIEENQNDTIIFDFQNDTLIITVGINYICCAKFNAIQNINDDAISLIMNDTTVSSEEYCRCECNYVFKYYFTNLSHESYEVNAVIKSPDSSVYKQIFQTFNIN
ncbi:MAG: hypothetical protein LBG80_06375 [Bacteroidales bacterium]|jgi:hypothetical protein|nr:hypothetical protein [Bacteroidales bacterium]